MTTKVKKIVVKKEEPIPSKYVVDILNIREPVAKDESIGQITWVAESNTLELNIQGLKKMRRNGQIEPIIMLINVTAILSTTDPLRYVA